MQSFPSHFAEISIIDQSQLDELRVSVILRRDEVAGPRNLTVKQAGVEVCHYHRRGRTKFLTLGAAHGLI